jgi:hypothetical protein
VFALRREPRIRARAYRTLLHDKLGLLLATRGALWDCASGVRI